MAAVIELGEVWTEPEVAPRRRLPGRTRAVFVVVAALAMLGGATAPPAPRMWVVADVATTTPSAMLLTVSDLYVGEVDGTLTDYPLPSGVARWRITLEYPVGELAIDAPSQVLLVKAPDTAPQIGQVSAFRTIDGSPLWSLDRSTIIDVRPGRMLVERQGFGIVPLLKWVDIRTGREIWSKTIAAGADVSAAGGLDPGPLLVTQTNGAAILLDERTGHQLAMGDFGSLVSNLVLTPGPAGAQEPPKPGTDAVDMVGDAVLVQARRGASPGSLTAFNVDTLARRWVVTGDLLGVPFRCGANVCVGSVDGLRAVDPITGETRWRTDRWQYATALDSGRLLAFSVGGRAHLDPLGQASRANIRGQSTGVIDANTGATLYDFGGEAVRVVVNESGSAVLAQPSTGGTFAIYRLYSEPLGSQPLGNVTGVDPRFCMAAADLLACVTHQDSVRVWRIAPQDPG